MLMENTMHKRRTRRRVAVPKLFRRPLPVTKARKAPRRLRYSR